MPSRNSENPAKGKEFQKRSAIAAQSYFKTKFELDKSLLIGHPAKAHKFDLASKNGRHIGECKSYSWTESGNVPSAKMAFINEAVFYLRHLPEKTNRFVIMRRDIRSSGGETLAEYYYRTYRHLLQGTKILEFNLSAGAIREVENKG